MSTVQKGLMQILFLPNPESKGNIRSTTVKSCFKYLELIDFGFDRDQCRIPQCSFACIDRVLSGWRVCAHVCCLGCPGLSCIASGIWTHLPYIHSSQGYTQSVLDSMPTGTQAGQEKRFQIHSQTVDLLFHVFCIHSHTKTHARGERGQERIRLLNPLVREEWRGTAIITNRIRLDY